MYGSYIISYLHHAQSQIEIFSSLGLMSHPYFLFIFTTVSPVLITNANVYKIFVSFYKVKRMNVLTMCMHDWKLFFSPTLLILILNNLHKKSCNVHGWSKLQLKLSKIHVVVMQNTWQIRFKLHHFNPPYSLLLQLKIFITNISLLIAKLSDNLQKIYLFFNFYLHTLA